MVELPDDLVARLAAASENQHVSQAEIVEKALAKELRDEESTSTQNEPSLYDSMKDGFGCVSSGAGDLSTNPKYMEGYGQGHRE